MILKQCKIYDKESDTTLGGIAAFEEDKLQYIICACCGAILEADDFSDDEDSDFELVEVYDNWIDFSENIIED